MRTSTLSAVVGAIALSTLGCGSGTVVRSASATGSTRFPPSIYPLPVASRAGAAFAACPNPARLGRFNSARRKLAEQVAGMYGHVSLTADLRSSDRSWWPMLRRDWRLATGGEWLSSVQVVRGSQLGGPKMVWSGVVRYYCGSSLETDSLSVVVTRRKLLDCADCNAVDLLFIDRRGRPLVYMVH